MIAVLVAFALLALFGYILEGVYLRSEYDSRHRRANRVRKHIDRKQRRRQRRAPRAPRPVGAIPPPHRPSPMQRLARAYRWADNKSRGTG